MKLSLTLLIVMSLAALHICVGQQAINQGKRPVLMHYMPWFDAPLRPKVGGHYEWGWHWTMNTCDPNIVSSSGRRQIASHYYPLIGPYASQDPDVIEYHLLLMKLSGIDGVLIDWYGAEGSNKDVQNLLTNSNALIDRLDAVGMSFALVIEDRFWQSVEQAKNNFNYICEHYFTKQGFIRVDGKPLVAVFGPITFEKPGEWKEILSAKCSDVELLTLWYERNDAGMAASGEYAWIYKDSIAGLTNFYHARAPTLKTAMGVAYPGFHDYYAEGGAGAGYFYIAKNHGRTLDKTLELFDEYKNNLDFLQLATFNDYGEGTVLEPTIEGGFTNLLKIQHYTGVSYLESDLRNVYKLFMLRKKYYNDAGRQAQLDKISSMLNSLQLEDAALALKSMAE